MVLLRKVESDNFISFRGPIEVETIPIKLNKGEELPVKKKDDGNYMVQIKRQGNLIPLQIPESTAGVSFNTKSEFAQFTEKQKNKGLEYFQGKWLPFQEVSSKKNLLEKQRLKKEALWKNFKKGAMHGVVILKHGGVLHGKISGSNDHKILFVSENRDYFLSIEDIAPLDFETIIARGKLDKATTSLNKAKLSLKEDRGVSMFHAEKAMEHLKGITKKCAEEYKRSEELLGEVSSLIENIDSSLAKSGESIYRNAVFTNEELNYHLNQGHVLLRRKIWLRPEQLCKDCHSSGKITCSECKGKGRVFEDCELCVKGRITCTICDGKGRKDCDYCGGRGYVYREKKGSTVFASFGCPTRRYYPNYNPGTIVYSKDKLIVVKPYRYYYPSYTGSYISIGNEGGGVEKKVCPRCGGTGTVPCPKTEKCTECRGVGYFIETCPTCKGNKKLSCPKCNGKGYNGSPQVMPEKTIPVEKSKEGHSYFNTPVIVP
jgi:hypothetical protein